MRTAIIAGLLAFAAGTASAAPVGRVQLGVPDAVQEVRSSYTRGYVTRRGTYVAPHYRTAPDRSRFNNWSTRGNINPYTGRVGTQTPYGYRRR